MNNNTGLINTSTDDRISDKLGSLYTLIFGQTVTNETRGTKEFQPGKLTASLTANSENSWVEENLRQIVELFTKTIQNFINLESNSQVSSESEFPTSRKISDSITESGGKRPQGPAGFKGKFFGNKG